MGDLSALEEGLIVVGGALLSIPVSISLVYAGTVVCAAGLSTKDYFLSNHDGKNYFELYRERFVDLTFSESRSRSD